MSAAAAFGAIIAVAVDRRLGGRGCSLPSSPPASTSPCGWPDAPPASARHSLTLVHLRALVEGAPTAEDIVVRAGVLLAGVIDGYEIVLADGTPVDGAVVSVAVRGRLRVSVVAISHPLPLDRDDLHFVDDVAATLRDALAERARRDELELQATTDALTGLPNRRALEPIAGERRRYGVLVLDVNNLKAVNDTLGHHAGDELLCEIAGRVAGLVREDDVVARIGGDEFVVVVDDTTDLDRLVDRLATALSTLSPPPELHVGVSIGTAVAGVDGTRFAELVEVADGRMYEGKRMVRRPVGYVRGS